MNTLEKLEALKAGEGYKVLDGTLYDGLANINHGPIFQARVNAAGKRCIMDSGLNAAKVEVAKAVVGEAWSAFKQLHFLTCDGAHDKDEMQEAKHNAHKALTLLNKLKEVL